MIVITVNKNHLLDPQQLKKLSQLPKKSNRNSKKNKDKDYRVFPKNKMPY